MPNSISVNYSHTNEERKYVDEPTTFIIGDGSNLKVGKVENTAVKAVYVDETLKNISDKFKDDETRPDVTIEYKDGTFKLIEVQSKTDRFYDLQDKLQNLQTKYGKDVIKNYKVEKPKGGK